MGEPHSRPKRRAVRVRSGEPLCSAVALRSARNGGHGRLGAEDGSLLGSTVLSAAARSVRISRQPSVAKSRACPEWRAVRIRSGESMCSAVALRSARNGGDGRLGAEGTHGSERRTASRCRIMCRVWGCREPATIARHKEVGGAGRRGQGVGAPILLAPSSLHGHNMAGC